MCQTLVLGAEVVQRLTYLLVWSIVPKDAGVVRPTGPFAAFVLSGFIAEHIVKQRLDGARKLTGQGWEPGGPE